MSRRKRKTIGDKLDELAESIIDKLLADDDIALDQRVDAFKALTTYRLGMGRLDAKLPEEADANGASFDKWKSELRGVDGQQQPAPRGR